MEPAAGFERKPLLVLCGGYDEGCLGNAAEGEPWIDDRSEIDTQGGWAGVIGKSIASVGCTAPSRPPA